MKRVDPILRWTGAWEDAERHVEQAGEPAGHGGGVVCHRIEN